MQIIPTSGMSRTVTHLEWRNIFRVRGNCLRLKHGDDIAEARTLDQNPVARSLDVIEWLNNHPDDEVGFFACRIEAWQIGTSEKAPRFDVIVEPRQLAAAPTTVRNAEPQGIDINRVAYWGAFSDEVRRRGLPFTLSGSLGIYLYAYREVAAQAIGAYVSFTIAPAPVPRLAFEAFQSDQITIEREFGAPLQCREVEPDRNYRIQVEPIKADPLDEADWPRQHKWLVDQIEKFHRIFEPRVRKLPSRDQMLASSASQTWSFRDSVLNPICGRRMH